LKVILPTGNLFVANSNIFKNKHISHAKLITTVNSHARAKKFTTSVQGRSRLREPYLSKWWYFGNGIRQKHNYVAKRSLYLQYSD